MAAKAPKRKPKGSLTSENDRFEADHLARVTAPPGLEDPENRKRWGLPEDPRQRGPYLVELNLQHVSGLAGAAHAFLGRFAAAFDNKRRAKKRPPKAPVKISKSYFRCDLNVTEWKELIAADERLAHLEALEAETPHVLRYRAIYKIWPDFQVSSCVMRSIATIKADAALRSFEATGEGIVWAVIDSGIDESHPHFKCDGDSALTDPWVQHLHRSFVPVNDKELPDPDEELPDGKQLSKEERESRLEAHKQHALQDPLGHGTHVAGIITGRAPHAGRAIVLEKEERIALTDQNENRPQRVISTRERLIEEREKPRCHGVAPGCKLVSLRVLDEKGEGRSSNIVRALEYIREKLNDNPKLLRVHGVNLSIGYEFDAEMFACGQSPLCSEVNRLVLSGAVVVTAAGNTGYTALTANNRVTKIGLSNTINDPGNAEHAITVGATHCEAPHTYGVSYFSSKGPTGDGRLKPDLVAPGERILSCAAGAKKKKAIDSIDKEQLTTVNDSLDPAAATSDQTAYYVEDSGTSMAAPHVSGAIAAFLSIRREFIGRPLDVKKIFLSSAIALGRERYFEGHGLVDLMKAIQSV